MPIRGHFPLDVQVGIVLESALGYTIGGTNDFARGGGNFLQNILPRQNISHREEFGLHDPFAHIKDRANVSAAKAYESGWGLVTTSPV